MASNKCKRMKISKTEPQFPIQILKLCLKDIFTCYHLLGEKAFRVTQVSSKHRNVIQIYQDRIISDLQQPLNFSS